MKNDKNYITIPIGVFIIIYFGFWFAVNNNIGAVVMSILLLICILMNKKLKERVRLRNAQIKIAQDRCRFCPYKKGIQKLPTEPTPPSTRLIKDPAIW